MFICAVNLLTQYLQYRFNSIFIVRKNKSFVDKVRHCLQKGNKKLDFENDLEPYRSDARNSQKKIIVTDFGAGSKKLGKERVVSSIYKTSVASLKFQRLMFHLIRESGSKNILEMGTSLGFSTVYLSKATNGSVTTIEACPQIFGEADTLFTSLNLKNVHAIQSTFQDYFDGGTEVKFDFVYIDGHHDGMALLNYIEILKLRLTDEAIVLVDDIRWSDSMKSAWDMLIADSFFHQNHDLFRMGILIVENGLERSVQQV